MNLLPKKGLWQYIISGPNDFMCNEQKESRIDSTLEASNTGETESIVFDEKLCSNTRLTQLACGMCHFEGIVVYKEQGWTENLI